MNKGLHYRHCLRLGILSLSTFGLTIGTAIAQTPPDVTIETEPDPNATGAPTTNDPRFVCQTDAQGRPTVMYSPESRPGELYPWAIPRTLGGGWTAERRCGEIARRLEMYRQDGLVSLTTGVENGYDIVCVTTETNNTCQIVFTVPPGQDAIATRNSVFENLASADQGIQTQGVNTYTDQNSTNNLLGQLQNILGVGQGIPMHRPQANHTNDINLKPFLAPEDGGTGEQLNGGQYQSRPDNRRLNPDLFR